MVRRRVRDKNANMRLCKFHPDREAVHNKNGQSTGMCPECLTVYGKKGAKGKWQKRPEPEAAASPGLETVRHETVQHVIADMVLGLAKPGAEVAVLQLLLNDLRLRVTDVITGKRAAG